MLNARGATDAAFARTLTQGNAAQPQPPAALPTKTVIARARENALSASLVALGVGGVWIAAKLPASDIATDYARHWLGAGGAAVAVAGWWGASRSLLHKLGGSAALIAAAAVIFGAGLIASEWSRLAFGTQLLVVGLTISAALLTIAKTQESHQRETVWLRICLLWHSAAVAFFVAAPYALTAPMLEQVGVGLIPFGALNVFGVMIGWICFFEQGNVTFDYRPRPGVARAESDHPVSS